MSKAFRSPLSFKPEDLGFPRLIKLNGSIVSTEYTSKNCSQITIADLVATFLLQYKYRFRSTLAEEFFEKDQNVYYFRSDGGQAFIIQKYVDISESEKVGDRPRSSCESLPNANEKVKRTFVEVSCNLSRSSAKN